jgi:hypothetical protein
MSKWIAGVVIAGYGVASGTGMDRRYPAGTLRLQQPFFFEKGIDLSPYFSGTLNVDLAPFKPVPRHPLFDGCIRWFDGIEERFILSPVQVQVHADGRQYSGLWYYPHPETKPAHQQKDTVVELLLPWIDGLAAGARLLVRLREPGEGHHIT